MPFLTRGPLFSTYTKFSKKTNISYPLIRTRTCAYQEVRNVSFSENFVYVLNGQSHTERCETELIHKQSIKIILRFTLTFQVFQKHGLEIFTKD